MAPVEDSAPAVTNTRTQSRNRHLTRQRYRLVMLKADVQTH